jgi:hypothetical protein
MSKIKDATVYSELIYGARCNYYWPVRFDMSQRGCVGITQVEKKDNSAKSDRILMSPAQVKELIKFVTRQQTKPRKRTKAKAPAK